ncbi:MAG: cupredoxin domain-containing protein [Herbaspirillum sp.]
MLLRTLLVSLLLCSTAAFAADSIPLIIKDHRFVPAEVRVPANTKLKLIVENQDPTAEEFESPDMGREKVIAPKSKATIFIGPLKPGNYKFFGEFNPATAQGVVIAE